MNNQTQNPQTIENAQATQNSKPWYQSKTLWFNTIVTGVGVAAAATPYIEPYIAPETMGLITAGIGFANAALRFVTNKPIGTKK